MNAHFDILTLKFPLQGFNNACSLGAQAEQIMNRPPTATETRWAGLLHEIAWINEFSSVV
jgi:hypothetical protein